MIINFCNKVLNFLLYGIFYLILLFFNSCGILDEINYESSDKSDSDKPKVDFPDWDIPNDNLTPNLPPYVFSISTKIPFKIDSSFSVIFSEEIDGTSVTTNTNDNKCSGTIQMSSDNYSSCITMSFPEISNSNKTFTFKPTSNLSYSTTYKIRVTNGVKDLSGKNLINQYERIVYIYPDLDNITTYYDLPKVLLISINIPFNIDTSFSIIFSEEIDRTSVTTNTNDNICSGTIQMSSDNYSSCITMSFPEISNSNKTFTFKPKSNLVEFQLYKIRVTDGVKDLSGKNLMNQYERLVITY